MCRHKMGGLTEAARFPKVSAMTDVVCAIIQDSEGRFLACLRPQGKHLAGLWEFPGGKVEPDETPEAALTRELHEELGVLVQVGTPLEPVLWNYDHGYIRLIPYFCTIPHGQPQAIEHEQLLWCASADFGSLSWADADLPILAQILAGIPEERVAIEEKPAEAARADQPATAPQLKSEGKEKLKPESKVRPQ